MSDLPQTQEVRGVCQHEAAHAIVALCLNHEVGDIGVLMDPIIGAYGATTTYDVSGREAWNPERMYDDFLISMAGAVLDAAAGRTHPGSLTDLEHANLVGIMLGLFYGGTLEQHIERARGIILEFLEFNSDRVFALCDLIMHGELKIEEFEVRHGVTFDYPQKGEFA